MKTSQTFPLSGLFSLCVCITLLFIAPTTMSMFLSPQRGETIGLGDSIMALCPGRFARVAIYGATIDSFEKEIPYVVTLLDGRRVDKFVIILGVNDILRGDSVSHVNTKLSIMVQTLQAYFPRTQVVVIPPAEILNLPRAETVDGLHLDPQAYKELVSRYPALS